MKSRRYVFPVAIIAVLSAMMACNVPLPAAQMPTPTVSNIRMTTDDSGKTPTSLYAPRDKFVVFADLSGLPPGSMLEAKWFAVNAEGWDPNMGLNTSDYKYEAGVKSVFFQLTTPDGSDWPKGSYRVELYLDGTKVGEQGFTVQ